LIRQWSVRVLTHQYHVTALNGEKEQGKIESIMQ
jgi:hypothetical protein